MHYSAVIFDLDGTLLDTLADIAHAANGALADCGFPTHPIDDYRRFVGDGVAMLMQRALPESEREEGNIARCAEQFRVVYGTQWNVRTRPYAGVSDLIRDLNREGVPLGVLSNKPHEFTCKCVDAYFDAGSFQCVLGQREGVPRKPDPAGVLEIVERFEVRLGGCAFVGDSSVDMLTARNAGVAAIGVTWGFRSRAELIEYGAACTCDTVEQLRRALAEGCHAN